MNTNFNPPKKNPNFEAMRRAGGLPPHRAALRRPEYMRAPLAARLLFHGMRLSEQPGVVASTLKRETISWRVSRNGWSTVHWFKVTEYAPELLRLRNDGWPEVPRIIWPFALPERRTFELTFHWTEIRRELGEVLFAFCSTLEEPGVMLGWPLFAGEQTYPGYAWTPKAREFYATRHHHV